MYYYIHQCILCRMESILSKCRKGSSVKPIPRQAEEYTNTIYFLKKKKKKQINIFKYSLIVTYCFTYLCSALSGFIKAADTPLTKHSFISSSKSCAKIKHWLD